MKISPVPNKRALKVKTKKEIALAVADLHLGMVAELSKKGIEIPNRVPLVEDRLMDLIESEEPDRLFFLGDVKHNVPVTSWQEWKYLPELFEELDKKVKVEIIPGNHDGDIAGMIPRDVTLHGSGGTTFAEGKVGFLHGHAWPDPELLHCETIVMGHNHPSVEFRDEVNARITEPAWVKTTIRPENLPENLREEVGENVPKIVVVPAFSKLVGGGAINRKIPEKLLGPLFENDAINLEEAEIRLMDGTFLGKVKNLRE